MNQRVLEYEAREQFISFHQRQQRWSAIVAHRRAGKTVACVNELMIRALYTQKKNARYAYVAPFYSQAKNIAWQYLKDAAQPFVKSSKDIRESDLSVKLLNGAVIRLYGSDNIDALRGIYLDGVVLDEFGDCRPGLWAEVILPTLADRKGWAVIIGTPKGKNTFFDMCEKAKVSDDWFFLELKAGDTNILDPVELAAMREQMTDAQYEQEFECSFTAPVLGTYYAGIVETMEIKGHIAPDACTYDPKFPVSAVLDLGYKDNTGIWFWQTRPDGLAIIDYEEEQQRPLEFYFDMLLSKPYKYDKIWLPHDAEAKTLQTGRSTAEQFQQPWHLNATKYPRYIEDKNAPDGRQEVEYFPVDKVPYLKKQQGIDAARLVLPHCRINSNTCQQGVEALRAYRRVFDDVRKVFSKDALHNWASDGADAFRYLALVAQLLGLVEGAPKIAEVKVFEPKPYTLEDLFKAREGGKSRIAKMRI